MPSGVCVAIGLAVLFAVGFDPLHLARDIGPHHGLGAWLVQGLVVGLKLVAGLWAYADAQRRGLPGVLVGAAVALVAWPLGVFVWLAVRSRWPETLRADEA